VAVPGARQLPAVAAPSQPVLSLDQKRRLQIMRVQIALTSLGLYNGGVDGTLNEDTKLGLQFFQDLKGLPKTGTMSTPTLNALGVPAVN
jgi:His-Xaa-Ser repeat protein HxsA